MQAEDVLRWAHVEFDGRLCLTCSWQKQSSVLVHMVAELDLDLPVIELDTHLFFRESYETRDRLIERYGLHLSPPPPLMTVAEQHRAEGPNLWETDPDRCCHVRKVELIAEFTADFTVLSEVGSKDEDTVYAPYQWVEWIKEELEAGAWKVITEGREGGTAGIYRPTGEMRTGLVDEIVHEVEVGDLIFEAPTKASQAWFVKQFGPNVNLGNIPPEEVIPLETLRLGLRGDTLKEILLGDAEPAAS